MASLYTSPESKYWLCAFRDREGRLCRRSTRIARAPYHEDPKERARLAGQAKRMALTVADEFEAVARGNRTEAGIRKTLQDIHSHVNQGHDLEFVTCRAFLTRWLERVETTKAGGTLARYRGVVNYFLQGLRSKADNHIQDITPQDIEAFTAARLENGRNATTVLTDLKTLNGPFALALKQGIILSNPVAAADSPTGEKEARQPFSAGEVEALIRTAAGEWKTAILFGALQGLRLGDAVGLSWSNIDLSEKVIRFRPAKTRSKKRDMVLPLHPAIETHLMSLTPPDNAPDAFLCPSLSKAKPGGRSGLSRQFQGIMAEAGLEQQTIAAKGTAGRAFNRWTFHSLRHAFVTSLEAAGVAPDQRMLLSGHSDAVSHARYSHTAVETLRTALAKLPISATEQPQHKLGK